MLRIHTTLITSILKILHLKISWKIMRICFHIRKRHTFAVKFIENKTICSRRWFENQWVSIQVVLRQAFHPRRMSSTLTGSTQCQRRLTVRWLFWTEVIPVRFRSLAFLFRYFSSVIMLIVTTILSIIYEK